MRLNWQVDVRMAEIASETAYKGEVRLAMSQKRSGLKMFDAIVRRWKLERSHRVINSLRANCFAAQHRARGEQEQSEVMMEVPLANPFVGVSRVMYLPVPHIDSSARLSRWHRKTFRHAPSGP